MTRPAPAQVFARRWWLLLLCAILGAALAVLYVSGQPKTYQSTAALVASPGTKSQSDQYVLQRVPTYPLILGSNVLLSQVAADLGPGFGVGDIEASVSAENPPNTAVVNITVTASTRDRAYRIASSVVSNGIKTLNDLESSRVTVSAIMTPDLSRTSVVSAHRSLYLLVGLIAGLAIGGASAMLFEQVRPRRIRESASVRRRQAQSI